MPSLLTVRLLILLILTAPLALSQSMPLTLEPVQLEKADGYARARVANDGTMSLRWQGLSEPVDMVLDGDTVLHEGAPTPLVRLNERIAAARIEVEGLGTVEIRVFENRGAILYALVDARRGTLSVDGRDIPVMLSRESQVARFNSTAVLGLDLDGDGMFVPESVADAGMLTVREQAPAYRARRVGDQSLSVDSVATDGSEMWVRLTDERIGLEPGFLSPDAPFVNLDGTSLRVSDLRGKTVILSWWATTCPYCAEERPLLNETAAAYEEEDDVVWLAPAMDSGQSAVEQFLTNRPYTPRVVMMTPEAEDALEGIVFPRHTVLDPDGRVVFDETGVREGRDADLHAAIAAARQRSG